MGLFDKVVDAVKPKHKWPDTDPIDKSDPYWECNNNMNCNGTAYKKEEVERGRWQWVVDEKMMKYARDREQHRQDLYWALRSRVLSDDEMREILQYGDGLNVTPNTPYYAADKAKELNEALLQQHRLRLATAAAPEKSG